MKKELALNLKLESYDFDEETTIKDFFKMLLLELWKAGESFSGKRPFGNSGWEYDVYKPLIKAGVITGTLDEDGYIENVDNVAADKIIAGLIEACFDK